MKCHNQYTHTHTLTHTNTKHSGKSHRSLPLALFCFVFSELIEPTLKCGARCHCNLWGLLEICFHPLFAWTLSKSNASHSCCWSFRANRVPNQIANVQNNSLRVPRINRAHISTCGTFRDFSDSTPMTMACAHWPPGPPRCPPSLVQTLPCSLAEL